MTAVGKISKSVGIRGEVKIALYTDSSDRFRTLKSVWIGADEASAVRRGMQFVRVSPSAVVLQLEGIHGRTEADELRGRLVFVSDKEEIKPKKGSYFIHEVIGMKVEDEAGNTIGTVHDVMKLPANDVWVVKSGKKEYLIPAIKEIIRSVDVGRRTVVIRPMEGLLD
jgi:16S rRNA processing protein RimM